MPRFEITRNFPIETSISIPPSAQSLEIEEKLADRGHSHEKRLISDAFHEAAAAAQVFCFYAAAAADLEVVIPEAVSQSVSQSLQPRINGYLDPAAAAVSRPSLMPRGQFTNEAVVHLYYILLG